MTEPTDKEQCLNIADQCAATATSDLAASILVDGGNGTLRQLLNYAADADRAARAQADSQPVPVVDRCTKQQMTAEVLRRMQQQEDGHNKNPFRSLLDRLMRNEGGYSTIEIGQLKYALDGFYGAAHSQADSVPKARFDDLKVQAVYAILCEDAEPPKGEHWEGFAARRIVDALSEDSVLEDAAHSQKEGL